MSENHEHVTAAALDRVRRGEASAEETAAIGAHVRACAACTDFAAERLAIADSVAAFEADFAAEDAERQTHARRVFAWSAAAAVAAATVAAMLVLRPHDDPRRDPVPRAVRVEPPVVVPVAPALRPEWRALLDRTRASRVLPFPEDIRALAAEDVFRGAGDPSEREAVWPAGTAIDDERPELRWTPMPGASYVVSVTSGGRELARSDSLTEARWRVPDALPRGATIRWQVKAVRAGETVVIPAPPAPPALFRIITLEQHDELARAQKEAGDDPLLLAILYSRAGMVREARRELDATNDALAMVLRKQLP